MFNMQPNYTYDIINKIDEIDDKIRKLADDIVTKILEHNRLSVNYVKAHPDEFSIEQMPRFGLSDSTINYAIMHNGTVLGNYTIHSCFDIDSMQVTYSVSYTLGGDS